MSVAILIALFGVAVVAMSIAYGRKVKAHRKTRLLEYSREIGGDFNEHVTFWKGDQSNVTAVIDGRQVTLATRMESTGETQIQYMVVHTTVAVTWSLSLTPVPKVLQLTTGPIGRRIETGHPRFDEAFALKSSRKDLARMLFGSKSELRDTPTDIPTMHVNIEHGEVELKVVESYVLDNGKATDMMRYAHLLATAMEEARILPEAERAQGGLMLAAPDEHTGALSEARAAGGSLTAADDPE